MCEKCKALDFISLKWSQTRHFLLNPLFKLRGRRLERPIWQMDFIYFWVFKKKEKKKRQTCPFAKKSNHFVQRASAKWMVEIVIAALRSWMKTF